MFKNDCGYSLWTENKQTPNNTCKYLALIVQDIKYT